MLNKKTLKVKFCRRFYLRFVRSICHHRSAFLRLPRHFSVACVQGKQMKFHKTMQPSLRQLLTLSVMALQKNQFHKMLEIQRQIK